MRGLPKKQAKSDREKKRGRGRVRRKEEKETG